MVAIIAAVAVSVAVLVIPDFRITAFNNTLERGDEDAFLGLTLGLDLQGGTHLVYRVVPEGGGAPTPEDVDAIRTIVERRVNEFGVSEATVQSLGNPPDRILVQIPGSRGATLTINFNGATVSPSVLETFFSSELNRPDARVRQNDDGSVTVELDHITPAVLDEQGNVLEPSEAETWRPLIEEEFTASIFIGYTPQVADTDGEGDGQAPDPQATATPEPTATAEPEPQATPTVEADDGTEPEPELIVPSIEELRAAFEAVGFPDVELQELAEGLYQANGLVALEEGHLDAQGNYVPGNEETIRGELRRIGELTTYVVAGNIIAYSVGGGVEEAKKLIGSTALLEFKERICGPLSQPDDVAEWPPDGLTLDEWQALRCDDPRYYQDQNTNINPDDLVDAFAGTVEGIARPVVNIVFNDAGGDAFFEVTSRIAENRDRLAILLDGEELVSPGASQGISGGRAYIHGPDFTSERARTIAIQLRAGALPASLELLQERNVDATLGAESLEKSLIAGAVGLALLLVFMTVYYKVPGVLAALTLVMYTAVLMAIFKLVPVTLTLSGAAAVILSLGFAVDANILIAERIKEELRTGRNLLPAINAGFDRAWPSIRDGNISTIITALVLFWFGDRFSTSIMQGFALTLGIGVLLSMFTAFFASRILLRLVGRSLIGRRTSLFMPVQDTQADQQAVRG